MTHTCEYCGHDTHTHIVCKTQCEECRQMNTKTETRKTLADLKRDIGTGLHIEYIRNRERRYNNDEQTHSGEWYETEIPERIQGVRYVSHKDTTGFYLKRSDDKSARGSFCPWPKASELEYIGDTFTITDVAHDGAEYQKRTYKIIRFN